MKTKLLLATIFAIFNASINAQTFWTEDFGLGCNQGNPAEGFVSTNGTWTMTNTGLNDSVANLWYISTTESGIGLGYCGSNGCPYDSNLTNRTLHIGFISSTYTPLADCGANYNAGGLENTTTNKRIESPIINCVGHTNITLSFLYFENGQDTLDNATVWYFNGAIWSLLIDLPKTALTCNPMGIWTEFFIALPASADNNPNVKIGFNWKNNSDAIGTDPSVAIDDISLRLLSAINENSILPELNIYPNPTTGKISVQVEGIESIEVINIQGELVLSQKTKDKNQKCEIDLSQQPKGIYIIKVTTSKGVAVQKVVKN